MLKFKDIHKLLEGTKLSGLTNNQLQEAMVGEYPISHGSKELGRLWAEVMWESDENWRLKFLEVDLLLDAMLNKIYESKLSADKKKEQIERIDVIRNYIKEGYRMRIDNDYLKGIVKDCQILIADYESKLRGKDIEIKHLKRNIK